VKFEAAIDLEKHKAKLNTSDPNAYVLVPPACFRLTCGDADLSDVQFGPVFGLSRFCRYCGVRVFGKGHLAKLGGDFCVVGIAALDGLVEDALPIAMSVSAH
jgi:hypothetical protein